MFTTSSKHLGMRIFKDFHWGGGIKTHTYANGRQNHYEYDSFGRMVKGFGPNPITGQKTLLKEIVYGRADSYGKLRITNYGRASWDGDPMTLDTNHHTAIYNSEWLDTVGNKVRNESSLDTNGKSMISEMVYNAVGQLVREYVPYKKGQSRGIIYTEYGRVPEA